MTVAQVTSHRVCPIELQACEANRQAERRPAAVKSGPCPESADPRLARYLQYQVRWSAEHVTKNGKLKTWADVVMDQEVES